MKEQIPKRITSMAYCDNEQITASYNPMNSLHLKNIDPINMNYSKQLIANKDQSIIYVQ